MSDTKDTKDKKDDKKVKGAKSPDQEPVSKEPEYTGAEQVSSRELPDPEDAIAQLDNLLPIDDFVEEVSVDGKTETRKGIYLLPNLFTTAALFAGFYAVINAMQGHFEASAIAIFVAMLLDGLDGRIARLTNTQSKFGEEYDSLSDMVSFGLAPALVVFSWSLHTLGKLGWAAAFIFVAGAAVRLARFNTQIASADSRYFTGLASPSAAGVLAGLVWLSSDLQWVGAELPFAVAIVAALLTILLGLLMVSNFRYQSFKGLDFKGRVPFTVIVIIIIVFSIIVIDPASVLLGLFLIYALSGPLTGWRKTKN